MSDPLPEPLSPEEVRATAELAALPLDQESLEPLTRALGTMLAHFERIASIDATRIPQGSPVQRRLPLESLREDRPRAANAGDPTRTAPRFEEGLFRVPRILE